MEGVGGSNPPVPTNLFLFDTVEERVGLLWNRWSFQMPKMKTNRAAAKRFKITKSGRIKYNKANRRHILTKKSSKRKRQLRGGDFLAAGDAGLVKRMLPNG